MKKSKRYYRRSPNLNLNLEFIECIMDKLSKKRHLLFLTLIFSGAIIGLYIATCDIKLPLTFEHMEGNVLQRENDTAKVIKRDEVPLEMKWKVEDIYKSDEDCMKDIDWAVSQVDKISSYSGKIANSAKDLLEYIEFGNDVQYVVEKAYMYSNRSKQHNVLYGRRACAFKVQVRIGGHSEVQAVYIVFKRGKAHSHDRGDVYISISDI